MPHVHLVFCLHNHQPEGNFDSVFAEATARSYRPFLELLPRHPAIKVCLHYTGMLFDWFEREDPDLLDRIRACVASGQVELLGGGYHEPILSVIPDRDKHGQLRKMSEYLIEEFDVNPRGMWLAERIWEQHLVAPMVKAGHDYTVLDDTHFLSAGLRAEDLDGQYITEENGLTFGLFPISRDLRYAIPFAPVPRVIEILRVLGARRDGAVAVYADDGEKFGLWPKTHELVWERGWLENLFSAFEAESSWLHTLHFSEVMDSFVPKGRIYLPDASYEEMAEWSLIGAPAILDYEGLRESLLSRPESAHLARFVRGGFWRNFLVKYPESNTMHKKMLRLSRRLQAEELRGHDPRLVEARHRIYAAQCNCPYWHGVFGGAYLPHLRHAVYHNLLKAEALLDARYPEFALRVDETDFDGDGQREILIETDRQNLYLSPADGGKAFLWEWKPAAMNLLDVMTRREEGYHARVAAAEVPNSNGDSASTIHGSWKAKESGLADHLVVDWYRKGSFIEHVLGEQTSLDDLARMRFVEQGDFANQPWDAVPEVENEACLLRVSRAGHVWKEGIGHPLHIEKTFDIRAGSDELRVGWTLTNPGSEPLNLRFAVELNYALLAGNAPDRYYWFDPAPGGEAHPLAGARGMVREVRHLGVTNEWDNVVADLQLDQSATVYYCPIETVTLSEDGFERTYQGSTIFLEFAVRVVDTWSLSLTHVWRAHH